VFSKASPADLVRALMGYSRVSARFRAPDAVLAIFVPLIGLCAFPHRWVRPDTSLYWALRRLAPGYGGVESPVDCYGVPYGPFARTEVLSELAGDLFVLSAALFVVCFAALGLTGFAVVQRCPPPRLTLWTLSTTAVSVFGWTSLWLKYL
jgi:hypothetical protein